MFKRKPFTSAKYIWLKVLLMILGFLGVIKVMMWLNEPKPEIFGLEPIPAKVIINNNDQTARTTSN